MSDKIVRQDIKALEQKKWELRALALSFIPEETESRNIIADKVIESFISLTPPSYEIPTTIRLITLDDEGTRGGSSRKPGNIYLNIG